MEMPDFSMTWAETAMGKADVLRKDPGLQEAARSGERQAPKDVDPALWMLAYERERRDIGPKLIAEAQQRRDVAAVVKLADEFSSDISPFEYRRQRLRECGVRIAADVHDAVVFDCLEDTPALMKARSWFEAASDGSVLALLGGTGVGKTVAAAWALCADSSRSARAVRSDELAFLSGSNYSADRDRFREIVEMRGLLVVDDVGTERDEHKARHCLFDVVDIRQGRGMLTLLTSNLDVAAFKARFCDRTLSRLRAVGGMYSCTGEDLRGGK